MISIVGMVLLREINTQNNFLISCFVLGSKFGIACTFNMAFAGNLLLFPVSVVITTYGVCNLFARLATILAPYVAELDPRVSEWTFVAVATIALVSTFFLKS